MTDHLAVLVERRDWLTARIQAKEQVGWDVVWDNRERDALSWAVSFLRPFVSEPRDLVGALVNRDPGDETSE